MTGYYIKPNPESKALYSNRKPFVFSTINITQYNF